MYPFLVLFILVVIPSTCKGLDKNECNVEPKNHYIEAGSDTEIVCQTSCVHGKISWTLDNKPIDESLSYRINSSYTVLSLRNFTHQSATLQCHSVDTKLVLGGTTVRTYSKPSNVSCVLHYRNQATQGLPELFTCNWEHQIDSASKINYTVLCDSSPGCPSQSEICSSHERNCTSSFHNIGGKITFVGTSTVIVRAKSADWEASSEPFVFEPLKILKITRPKLSVTAISDHLLVEWSIMSRIRKKYHCQVKYSKAVDEGTEWVQNKTLEINNKKGNVITEKVESCSNYTVAVRCALGQAPWSDWSLEKTVLTKLNKHRSCWSHASSVEWDVKLHLWRKVAEAENNGVRKVHAMWTEIPSTCQETITYSIKQTPYREHRTGVNYTDTLCSNPVCDVDVNQAAHRIHLQVFNNESLFVEDSVYVPAIGESLPRVTDIKTSILEGVILVSWKAPVQPVSGYMIDYTHNGNQFYWKETKYTNATLFDLLDKKPYNITVTPLFDDKTGHGTQALQICSRVGDPGNVNITVQAKDKSAIVRWNLKSQEACSGVVVNYTIFYGTQQGPQLNVTVDSTNQEIFLKDLTPETQYSVYVKATALTGSTKSSESFFKTKMFDPVLITALAIGGGIFIVLVLCFGICCAIQWKKFKEKPFPNPGLSTVVLWPSTSHEQEKCHFCDPSESFYDSVILEEAETMSTSSQASVPAPDVQSEDPDKPVETQHPSSPGESTELLPLENSPLSPYRSQSSAETSASRTSKPRKLVPVKQQEKSPPLTVYVTLNMFEQGQGR